MSGGVVRKLLDPTQTLRTLRKHPLATGDHLKSVLAAKQKLDIHNNLLLAYEHVPQAQRICWFDIRPDVGETYRLYVEPQVVSTQFLTGRVKPHAKTLRPIFYLPYRKNGTTRMKLEEPPAWTGGPVSFFSTAMIDGCSVYVEGPATSPKVTHANAMSVQPTASTDTYPQKQIKIAAKINVMDARVQHIKKGPASVVERPAYMIEDPVQVQAVKQRFATARGIAVGDVIDYAPFGAVVGVKSGAAWTFYLQKNGTFDYDEVGTRGKTGYMVLDVCEIFPNGGALVRLMP